ncbi:MAG: trypsin-like peptidase domain-containing protein [Methylacidiphilales bacterium]|nr:trypsin-like peptidase domain-containing protein [Candidatus Methylacidiphilales bacterium]
MKTHILLYVFFALAVPATAMAAPATTATASTPTPAPAAQPTPALTAPQGKVSPPGSVNIANEPTVKVVANVLPAVVNITAQETVPEYYTAYNNYFQLYRGVRNRSAQSIGSGLIVSADGYIVTNAHVVALAEKEKEVSVTLSTGSKYEAQIISADDDADLALLKIDDKTVQFPYFDLTYTSPNLLGETVIALGSPAGYQNSVSEGILSALHRTFTVEDHTYANLIQTDAAINPGNSGGPLVDLNGGLVGINSAKLAGEAIESIGFAIPSDVVVPWVNDAMAVARGLKPAPVPPEVAILEAVHQRLGLSLKALSPDDAADMGLQLNGGMIITGVEENSPAARAGLRENMIVVAIGRQQITDEKSLPHELQNLQSGANVRLHVIYIQSLGLLTIQRGGSVLLTAR